MPIYPVSQYESLIIITMNQPLSARYTEQLNCLTVGKEKLSALKSSSVRFFFPPFHITFLTFYSDVLDGAMITLAMYTMNFAHPGLLLGRITGLPDTRVNKSTDSSLEKVDGTTD